MATRLCSAKVGAFVVPMPRPVSHPGASVDRARLCPVETDSVSLPGKVKAVLVFQNEVKVLNLICTLKYLKSTHYNQQGAQLDILWVDPQGSESPMQILNAGQTLSFDTCNTVV